MDAQASYERHLSIPEVAEALGVSVDTVRRRLRVGAFPRAFQLEANNQWRIPVGDLPSTVLTMHPAEVTRRGVDPCEPLRIRIAQLEQQVALSAAYAQVIETQQRNLEDLRAVIQQLTSH